MAENPFNPKIPLRGGLTIRPSQAAAILSHLGIAGVWGEGLVPRRPTPGNLVIGIPGVGGIQLPGPENAVRAFNVLLSGALDEQIELRVGEPSGMLGEGFFLGRPGSFQLSVGEPAGQLGNSAPIWQNRGGSGVISITFVFKAINGAKDAGWSEKYQTGDSDLEDAATMLLRYQGFIRARVNMLAPGCQVTAIRFVDEVTGIPPTAPQSRKVTVAAGPTPSLTASGLPFYNPLSSSTITDFSGTKAQLRAQTAPVAGVIYKRTIWMGGLPDESDTPKQPFLRAGFWTLAYSVFKTYLQPGGGFPALLKIRDLDKAQAVLPVLSIDTTGLIYAFSAPHGWADGTVINAAGFKCSKGGCKPTGLYRVVVVDATHISLRNAAASSRVTSLGGFRKVNWIVNDVTSVGDYNVIQRKVGRPSNVQRGKSSRRLATRA